MYSVHMHLLQTSTHIYTANIDYQTKKQQYWNCTIQYITVNQSVAHWYKWLCLHRPVLLLEPTLQGIKSRSQISYRLHCFLHGLDSARNSGCMWYVGIMTAFFISFSNCDISFFTTPSCSLIVLTASPIAFWIFWSVDCLCQAGRLDVRLVSFTANPNCEVVCVCRAHSRAVELSFKNLCFYVFNKWF